VKALIHSMRRARIPRLVERYKGAVLAAAFRGELTEVWRLKNGTSVDGEWRQTTLGEISTDVRYGQRRSATMNQRQHRFFAYPM
jgi:hypothetical protein